MGKKLIRAAMRYQGSIGEEQYFPEDIEKAFKEGAKWQEQQSPWRSVKNDLPYKHVVFVDKAFIHSAFKRTKKVLVMLNDNTVDFKVMEAREKGKWRWLWNVHPHEQEVVAWMPIPEYRKGGEEQ